MNQRLNPSSSTNQQNASPQGGVSPRKTVEEPIQPVLADESPSSSVSKTCVDVLAKVFIYKQSLVEDAPGENPLLSRFTQGPKWVGTPRKEAEERLRQLQADLDQLQIWSAHTERKIHAALQHSPQQSPTTAGNLDTLSMKPPIPIKAEFSTKALSPDLAELRTKIDAQFSMLRQKTDPQMGTEFEYTLSSAEKGPNLLSLLEELKELNQWLEVLRRQVNKTLPKQDLAVPASSDSAELKLDENKPPSKPLNFFQKVLSFLTKPT